MSDHVGLTQNNSGKKFVTNAIITTTLVLFLLFVYYKQQKQTEDPLISVIKSTISPLSPKVNELKFIAANRSYTRNKKIIGLCIKRRDGSYYSFNTLIYVAIHELAHALYQGDSKNHNKEWKQIFYNLLDDAHAMGIYNKDIEIERGYCGT